MLTVAVKKPWLYGLEKIRQILNFIQNLISGNRKFVNINI